MALPDPARPLLALPPSRFVAARNALAAALAEKGDPAAGLVRRLRRPVGLAWVMNRLARDRPAEVEALLTAGERLRSGQRRALAGEGAEELRAGDAELRRAARTLREAAGTILAEEGRPPDPFALARLELLLRAAAAAPGEAREALRGGTLAREPTVASGDLSGFALLGGGGDARPGEATARRPPEEHARRGEPAARESAARRAREREVRAARTAAARAEAAADRADAEARRAEDASQRAAEALRGADERARSAAERAAELRRRAEAARAEALARAAELRRATEGGGGERS